MSEPTIMDDKLALMKELTEAPGVPGQEHAVRAIMRRHLEPLAELQSDNLGSVIGKKVGTAAAPRIMIAGHMDEVGFMVTRITDEGFLRFQGLGGWWDQVLLAQRVVIQTHKGTLMGVIGSKPPHILPPDERKKPVERKDMFIDIGVASREEAEKAGVRPGDPIIPVCPFTVMANPKYLMAKAWDNRFGCYVVIEVLRALQESSHPNAVYGVATVQEEVGLRGATTATGVIEPDIGFSVDTGIAGDTPGIAEHEAQTKLGKGPCITLYDASMVPHLKLRDLAIETAEQEGIPYQFEVVAGGGTDAGKIHVFGHGVPSLAIGVPVRYIHSHAAILHRDDVDNTVRLLVAMIKRLDAATVQAIKQG